MPPRAEDVGKPSQRRVRVTVISADQAALDALGSLSDQLGLSDEALPRKAPFQLDVEAPLGSTDRLTTMLTALGLKVRLDDTPIDASVSMAIRAEIWASREALVHPLAALVDQRPDTVAQALCQPGGLILNDIPPTEAERLRRALRRIRGLAITLSDPASATYDVFAVTPPQAGLLRHLRLLGQLGDPVTGALAAGLDQRLCRHLSRRFDMQGLLILDRTFQRYDILLTGTGRWVSTELADFLTGRTALPRARFETVSPENPIRIELGLTHSAARHFHADYAALDLETRLVLTGRENP